jgi:hypothetical protein
MGGKREEGVIKKNRKVKEKQSNGNANTERHKVEFDQ